MDLLLINADNKVLEKESITDFHDYKDNYCEWCYKYGNLKNAKITLITDKQEIISKPYCNWINKEVE